MWRGPKSVVLILALLFAGLVPAAVGILLETWDTDPPGSNKWFYYVEGGPNDGDVDTGFWQPVGGVAGGFIQTPLASLTDWSATPPNDLYPAYTYGDNYGVQHLIDLTQDRTVQVWTRGASNTGPALADLGGGSLHFWIGEWVMNGPQPEDDEHSFFFFNTPLAVGTGWAENVLQINPDDWTVISDTQGVTPADLFVHPQQWGFGIFGSTAAPSGFLGFDSLAIVPEPHVTGLLALGLGLLALRRGRR